jgi:excisionase family DNA binding protein
MRSFPEQPDLTPRQVARLSGTSYWTVLREIERGRLLAYRRPGNRLAIRRDDFCAWAYGEPISPKERVETVDAPAPQRARQVERGSLTALAEIERRHRIA